MATKKLIGDRQSPQGNSQGFIDRIRIFKNVVFADGWSDIEHPTISLLLNGAKYVGQHTQKERPDLAGLFGERARFWGFEVVFVTASFEEASHIPQGEILLDAEERIVAHGMGQSAAHSQTVDHIALMDEFFSAVGASRGARVLEIGSRARSGLSRRDLFPGCDYVGMDVVAGPNVDIVGDAHELSKIVEGQFDFVYSVSVFEHLLMPWKVAVEISKIMKPGGLIFTQTHQCWPIHDEPWDFWRFSSDCWDALFNPATGFEMIRTALFDPLNFTPAYNLGNLSTAFDDQRGYGGVSALARARGPAAAEWAVSLTDVLKSRYPA